MHILYWSILQNLSLNLIIWTIFNSIVLSLIVPFMTNLITSTVGNTVYTDS